MSYWVLILIIGSKTSDYPNVQQHDFHSKSACVQMLNSLKSQRSDVTGHCQEDLYSNAFYSYGTVKGVELSTAATNK